MDDKRVADYFVVAGLDWNGQPLSPLEDVFANEATTKTSANQRQDPFVELAVINRSMGETIPEGFKCIEFTPTGFPADLNHGSLRAPEMYLCFRRGRDMPAIVDVGVLYEGKERILPGCEVIYLTPHGRSANVNNTSSSRIFVTFRRAEPTAPCDTLVVTEICVILFNKGETAPHAHCIVRKTLNKGMMGSDVYLCYKKSMAKVNCFTYKPTILGRYPLEDLPNLPLPQQVSMFCLPMGATLESWSPSNLQPTPVFSTFILTTGPMAEKLYGAAIVFHELLPRDKVAALDQEQRRALGILDPEDSNETNEVQGAAESPKGQGEGLVVHQNKSICLLSRCPFFDTFKKFLFYIYRLVFSRVDDYSHQIPIEKHIAHFLTKIPMPCMQRPRIMIQLSSTSIMLTQPDESPLPKSGASFVDILQNLGPCNCILLLLSALMEHKILVHSLRPAVLTSVVEAIAAMLFPLHWQCPYIPLCPLSLSYVLQSPTPFIVGIDSRYFDTYELPADVTCVDLDTNTLTISEDRRSHTIKMLPKKPAKLLRSSLEKLYERLSECPGTLSPATPREGSAHLDDTYFNAELAVNKKRVQLELLIREAYLRFMASTLKGYNNFLLPITNAPTDGVMDLNSLFDILGFVKSRDKAYHKFYALLMKTQAFSRFIEERSFVSDKDSCLAFFDYCLERLDENQDNQRLIDIDEALQSSERTVLIMGPEPDDLNEASASYPGYFPALNPANFPESSPALSSSSSVHPSQTDSCLPDSGRMQRSSRQSGSKVAGYNSPMVCRTQHEVKQSQKIAMKHANVPNMWARFLAWHCYSLWFIHLASYAKSVHSKTKFLRSAYSVLVTMQSAKLQPPDEVCYRVLMQLCGIYHMPVLAVKVLFEMRRRGVQPNAITYGFYNKAVLESKWPSSNATADQLWTKLRNVIMAVARFKRGSSYYLPQFASLAGPGLSCSIGANQSKPPLPHSNSESDPDRQSMDSYLDSVSVEASTTGVAITPSSHASVIVSNVIGSSENMNAESTNLVLGTAKSSNPCSPRKLFTVGDDQSAINDSNNRDRNAQNPSLELRLDSDTRKTSGNRQRARSTSEMGGDLDLIDSMKNKSKESISAGGLSDRGYGSLSMEETKDTTIFSPQNLSSSAKNKDTHKSADVASLHGFPDDGTTTEVDRSEGGGCGRAEQLVCSSADLPGEVASGSTESLPALPLDKSSSHPVSNVRVPVTQNDPLGLFDPPPPAQTSKTSSPEDDRAARMSKSAHELPFSSTRQPPNEVPSKEEASPFQTTASRSVERSRGNEPSTPTSWKTRNSQGRTPGWVSLAAENVVGGGSELFGSALKMVTTRFSRYRDAISNSGSRSNVSTTTASHRAESISSLNSAESSSDGSYGNSCPPSKHHSDKRHGDMTQVHDSESGVDVCLPTHSKRSSVTFQEVVTPSRGGNSGLSKPKPTPFVSNLWNGLKTLHKSDAFKGFTSGLSQMGLTVKESLAPETWGLSNGIGFGMTSNVGIDRLVGDVDESEDVDEEEDELGEDKWRDVDLTVTSKSFPSFQLDDPNSSYTNSAVDQAHPRFDRSARQDSNLEFSLGDPHHQPHRGSLSSIPSTVSGAVSYNPTLHPIQVEMCTMNKCTKCLNLLYDEEVMAGWTADDSNLNTSCQFCTSLLVPFINVYIKDYRPFLKATPLSNLSQSSESILSCQSSTANQHPSLSQQPAVLTLESTPTPDTVASIGSTPSALSPTTQLTTCAPAAQNSEAINIESPSEVSPQSTTPPPSPTVDRASTKRCASVCSFLDGGKDAKDLISSGDGKNKTGSVDALNDSSVRSPRLSESAHPLDPLSRSEDGISVSENDDPVKNFVELDPLCYPYLSPLVLRKEVENLLLLEGDMCFDNDTFLDEHPILFWNLVWCFKRINVTSHLLDFIATSKLLNQHLQKREPIGQQQTTCSQSKCPVAIRTMWDNVRLHGDHGPPMYVTWNQGVSMPGDTFSKNTMATIIESVMKNDVARPLRIILSERSRHLLALQQQQQVAMTPPTSYRSFHSMYRDVLFLSFVALGRENIDIDAFDKEFKNVLANLPPNDAARLRMADRAPRAAAINCRKMFKDLDV